MEFPPNRHIFCPNCGVSHFVKKLGKIYCSKLCADTHYNHTKRGKHPDFINNSGNLQIANSLFDNSQLSFLQMQTESYSLIERENDLKENIRILNSLPVDREMGTHYSFEYLNFLGFKFKAYEIQARYYNISEEYKSRYLIYGDFMLFRTDYKIVLVSKESNPLKIK